MRRYTEREFTDLMAEKLREFLPGTWGEYTIATKDIEKTGGRSYYGITMTEKGSSVGICLNTDEEFERYMNGESIGELVKSCAEKGVIGLREGYLQGINHLEDLDYGILKHTLVLDTLPLDENRDVLKNIPCLITGDIAVVFRFLISETPEMQTSTLVTKELMNVLGVDPDTLYRDAMTYAPQNFPAVMKPLHVAMADLCGMPMELAADFQCDQYVLTTENYHGGAGAMFYPDVLSMAASEIEDSFYIIPSSVHETILVREKGNDPVFLEKMLCEVNRTELQPGEKLSDTLYHYDRDERIIETAGDYILRKEKTRDTRSMDISR